MLTGSARAMLGQRVSSGAETRECGRGQKAGQVTAELRHVVFQDGRDGKWLTANRFKIKLFFLCLNVAVDGAVTIFPLVRCHLAKAIYLWPTH